MMKAKKFAFFMAVVMLATPMIGAYPRITNAAEGAKAVSFTANNSGIEVGESENIVFTAELDKSGLRDVYITDEDGDRVAKLYETEPYKYEAKVNLSADKRETQTYSLNTANGEAYTCDISFYTPLTEADRARDARTWEGVKKISSTITAENSKTVTRSIFDMLKSDSNVEEVWYETDTIINFITEDGVANVYDAELSLSKKTKSVKSDAQGEVSTFSGTDEIATESEAAPEKANPSCIGSKNICVIAPYYGVESDFTDRYLLEAENLKSVMGGGTINAYYGNGSLTGQKGDVNAFKNFGGNGIIMIDSHGSLYNGESIICVNYTSGASSSDYSSRRVVQGEDYLGIRGSFITYYNDSLPDSIVWGGMCYGMHSTHLSSAFKNLGAEFMTGFSMSVAFIYENQLFSEYMKRLRSVNSETGQFNTVGEAFDLAVDRFGDTDPYGSESARWKKTGNENLVIARRNAPIEIDSVEISPKSATVAVGETLQLQLISEPENAADNAEVTWASFDDTIASVSSTGKVKGESTGVTRITCEVIDGCDNTFYLSAEITVSGETHSVEFIDGLTMEVIDSFEVEDGEAAEAPEPPKHEGYVFIGWDKDFSKVTSNMSIVALYMELGDVNCDEILNTGDAVVILRYAADIISLSDVQMELGDYNEDGAVNTADAVAILRYAAR